jgi:hypothetical protein
MNNLIKMQGINNFKKKKQNEIYPGGRTDHSSL